MECREAGPATLLLAGGLLVAVLVLVPASGVAAVTGSPHVAVYVTDGQLEPGSTAQLSLVVLNDGEVDRGAPDPTLNAAVTTARGLTLALENGSAPVVVETGRQPVGDVPGGRSAPVTFRVRVPADADPGSYRLPVRVAYSHVSYISEADGAREYRDVSLTDRVTVDVSPRARFAVVNSSFEGAVGSTGTVRLTVENVGAATARDARLSLSAPDPALGGAERVRYVGSVAPGERRTVTYDVSVSDAAATRAYPLGVSSTYRLADGRVRSTDPVWANVRPSARPAATVSLSAASLRAGSEGSVRGSVTYAGPARATDAVLVVTATPEGVRPVTTRLPLGDVRAGQPVPFTVPVRVARGARPGPRVFSFALEYQPSDADDQRRTTRPETNAVRVSDSRLVQVSATNASVQPDSDSRVAITVENVGNRTLTDLRVATAPTPPFASQSPTAFVSRLAPGESSTVGIHLNVAEDAVVSTHALRVNVTAETTGGDAVDAGSHAVAVAVVRPETTTSRPVTLLAAGLVVALVLGAGLWWLRQ